MLNWLKLGMRAFKAKHSSQLHPFKLTLALTYRCNLRCKYCSIWQKKPVDELTLSEIDRFFRNNPFPWIDLTGGEIFLREDLIEIFKIVLKRNPDLFLLNFPTNGFLTEKIVKVAGFVRGKFKGRLFVSVSLDGPKPLHDSLRGVPGAFDRAIETFRQLSRIKGLTPHFGFTINEENFKQLDATISSVQKLLPFVRHKDFHLNLVENSAHFYATSQNRQLPEFRQCVECFIKKFGKPSDIFHFPERYYMGKILQKLETGRYPLRRCTAWRSSIFVSPDGSVYPCISYSKRIANLRKMGFKLGKLRAYKGNILKECPICWNACDGYPSIVSSLFP